MSSRDCEICKPFTWDYSPNWHQSNTTFYFVKQFYKNVYESVVFGIMYCATLKISVCDNLLIINRYYTSRPYIVQPIPKSNLILLVVNGMCQLKMDVRRYSTTPQTIMHYNDSMPCVIANKNNFIRRQYIKCFNRNDRV